MWFHKLILCCNEPGCDVETNHSKFPGCDKERLIKEAINSGWEVKGDDALCPGHFQEALDEELCEPVVLNDVVNPSGYVPQPYEG